jgi:orotate phosphoribosyltransferase
MKIKIAKALIQKNCVKFSAQNPFTYASGLKGPIYCDNRLILSHVDFREMVIEAFLSVIKERNLKFDLIGGIATAGIPHAAFIADRLKMPMVYVRPKAKDHGKKNQVEGDFFKGQSVLLVEDLVNQGSSLSDAMKGVVDCGLVSSLCLAVVDYQMGEANKRLNDLNLKLISLTDFEHLILAGRELNLISENDQKLLLNWHADPKGWSNSLA